MPRFAARHGEHHRGVRRRGAISRLAADDGPPCPAQARAGGKERKGPFAGIDPGMPAAAAATGRFGEYSNAADRQGPEVLAPMAGNPSPRDAPGLLDDRNFGLLVVRMAFG